MQRTLVSILGNPGIKCSKKNSAGLLLKQTLKQPEARSSLESAAPGQSVSACSLPKQEPGKPTAVTQTQALSPLSKDVGVGELWVWGGGTSGVLLAPHTVHSPPLPPPSSSSWAT